MDLFQINKPLKIIHPIGGERIIAELFKGKDGIWFADVGWYEASFHPFHFVPGEIEGEGPWKIGDCQIMIISPDDPLYPGYKQWDEAVKENGLTRQMVAKLIYSLLENDEIALFKQENNLSS